MRGPLSIFLRLRCPRPPFLYARPAIPVCGAPVNLCAAQYAHTDNGKISRGQILATNVTLENTCPTPVLHRTTIRVRASVFSVSLGFGAVQKQRMNALKLVLLVGMEMPEDNHPSHMHAQEHAPQENTVLPSSQTKALRVNRVRRTTIKLSWVKQNVTSALPVNLHASTHPTHWCTTTTPPIATCYHV